MHKIILVLAAIVVIGSWDCVTPGASAGELAVVRHSRCGGDRPCPVYRRIGCPEFNCYSIYGAYGPYGGPAYWGRYSYSGYHPIVGYFGVWSPWP
jgi:hypothetical protein